MADVIVDVILPNAITTDVTSPSYPTNANVFIPGADGPQGPMGPAGPSGSSDVFKIIKVSGQPDLIPTGAETLEFIAGTGISILTNTDKNPYKSIKIDASPLSGYFEGENIVGYKANLTAGADNYYILYPTVLNTTPRSVVCAFQNTIDDMAYYFSIGSITNAGFYINFSDTLLNNGYYLNIQVKK
jgi:hypothetical protein